MNIYGNNRKTAFTLAESATHVAISHNTRRVAFTLAEVLITLGILGIVSAMTIPTLVKNYEKQQTLSQLKKTYAIIKQVEQMQKVDHEFIKTNLPAREYIET